MVKLAHTVNTMAALVATLAPLVTMTVPADAGSTPHKKPPIAQKIAAPDPVVPIERPGFNAEDQAHAIIPGMPDARFWGDSEKDFLQATRGAMGPWLALSAGGADGSFGAGLLEGLSASGQRPDFLVVTGVSTGGLMAPFAFVGARQDENLRKIYTTINAGDIFEMAQTRESLLDTWPLRKTIERQLTPELLDEIAAEHRKGRRLFVVTVNIDAGRPVVWNMGAIAAHGGEQALKLFRQVLLASASLPGVFPPVYIDVESADGKPFREMHGDGGMHAQFYIAPESMLSTGGGLPATELYVIINGKLQSDFAKTDGAALTLLARSISLATTTAMRGQLLQAYLAARRQEIGFHVAMVASSFIEENHGPFDTVGMQALFDFGRKQGQGATPFLNEPPAWVRGRGLSIFGAVMFGSLTLGSAIWGKVAAFAGLPTAHLLAALGALLAIPLLKPWKLQTGADVDLTPSMHWPEPVLSHDIDKDRGPVFVTIEYQIRPQDRDMFLNAMAQLGAERRRDGAFDCRVFEDIEHEGRFIETFMLDSWIEHLRQHQRVTDADRKLQESVHRFQVDGTPKVTHLVLSEPGRG